jgi:hypothetical protein
MASSLRRTDDLQRLKTRNLVLQNTDGTYPNAGGIVYIDNAAGHVGSTGITAATINSNGYIKCNNICARNEVTTADDNLFTSMSIQNKVSGNYATVGRIATSAGATDQMYIEGARYIRFTDIDVSSGDITMEIDTFSNIVTVGGNLTVDSNLKVKGISDLQTIGDNINLTTTSLFSNAGHISGERKIGRFATDGSTGASPSGTFFVQGEKFVTLTTLDNTPGTMPVYVDVSAGQTNINGTLVLNPIGFSTPYGGVTIASPLFSSGARTGEMYFTGTTLYIKTTSGGTNYGWRSIQLN